MNTRSDNRQSEREPAEGPRENVHPGEPNPAESGGDAGAPMERGAGQVSQPDKPLPSPGERTGRDQGELPRGYPSGDSDNAGGITNRPLSEEKEDQQDLPPRERQK